VHQSGCGHGFFIDQLQQLIRCAHKKLSIFRFEQGRHCRLSVQNISQECGAKIECEGQPSCHFFRHGARHQVDNRLSQVHIEKNRD